MKALQAPMGYSFSSFPISSPITPPRPRFCRVIRAQAPKLQLSRKQFCLMSIIQVGTGENVLQKHAAFFDRNNDGIVYPWETFEGFRAIGSNIPLSLAASVIINVGLSQNTRPGKFPSLLFPIEVNNIAKAKHGSDTGVYDTEGRFVPSKFEAIFSKHARTNPNALTSEELDEMLKANREKKDFQGWFGAWVEWRVLYFLCKDKNGLLQKDTIRASYDGSLFEKMQSEQLVKHKT